MIDYDQDYDQDDDNVDDDIKEGAPVQRKGSLGQCCELHLKIY